MLPGAGDRQLAWRLSRRARVASRAQARTEAALARAAQRRERRRDKARAALPKQAAAFAVLGLASIALDGGPQALVGGVAFFSGLAAARSFSILYSPEPLLFRALPAATAPAAPVPLPPAVGSVAFPFVRRLEVVREELRRLVPLVSPAGREAAEEAWQAAAEADTALRWQAVRLAAVEPHRGADPALLRALEEGVGCQERLVTAVADLVAASADPLATSRLQEAADRLHGLAQGLREVS
ncbi:MAG: hypothetical protein WD794_08645 [Mycobacteriales bacterium]